ncbi:MAG: hypothetical protein K8F91_22620 [Candidatus Obscuribacterales bacterium]|nr:hypothetical protein [Candidatus Obscuribacterales bacterium]
MKHSKREQAARRALDDIKFLLAFEPGTVGSGSGSGSEIAIGGAQFVDLLLANFNKLDWNDDGISRDELTTALIYPQSFAADEYEMLKLVAKYFDTIINMVDDEPGEELRITRADVEVLAQFVIHSGMTLEKLHMWCSLEQSSQQSVGPPPMTWE